jgi:hypothetical protein
VAGVPESAARNVHTTPGEACRTAEALVSVIESDEAPFDRLKSVRTKASQERPRASMPRWVLSRGAALGWGLVTRQYLGFARVVDTHAASLMLCLTPCNRPQLQRRRGAKTVRKRRDVFGERTMEKTK